MKRLYIGAIFVGAASAALACRGDPTASLRGGAKFLDVSATVVFIAAGDAKGLSVVVRDEQQNPLDATVTVASLNAAVADVVPNDSVPSPNGAHHDFILTGVAPGATKLVVQSSGLADTVVVSVLPVNFGGTVSKLTPKGGDTVVVTSTAVLKFDSLTSALTLGHNYITLRQTRDTIKFLMPFTGFLADSATHVNVTYVPGLVVTLPLAAPLVQTGDLWSPGDSGYATAPQIALPTSTGGKTYFLTNMIASSNDPDCGEGTGSGATPPGQCAIYKYVANGTDSLTFSVDWEGAALAPDIDTYSCGSAGVSACFEDPGTGATGAKPQAFTFKPTAGTHYLLIELFDGAAPANIYVTITKRN